MARALIRDLLEDLEEFTPSQVAEAAKAYRRDPSSRFFPTSGRLRQLCLVECHETATEARTRAKPEFGDARPIGWEYAPRRFWKPHWAESDLAFARDPERLQRYEQWRKRHQGEE
jgi:hypothetical protein